MLYLAYFSIYTKNVNQIILNELFSYAFKMYTAVHMIVITKKT